ncbi:MAG: hypothetical protein PHF86_11370 [Candidatus Nanoarchaeia archaeon]|nr:hypothetical protein [Candidatus Nanoarchaeia archaeon]
MTKETIDELFNALKELNISEFVLDASKKTLDLKYKEDFDNFFPKFNGEPTTMNEDYGTPYGAGNIASFMYEEWTITGNIKEHKK